MNLISPVSVFLIPFMAALFLPMLRLFRKDASKLFSITVLLAGLCISGMLLGAHAQGGTNHYYFGNWAPPAGITWKSDALSAFIAAIVCLITFMGACASPAARPGAAVRAQVPYFMCLLLMTAGLIGIVFTGDTFNLFVFLEVSSIALYALAGSGRDAKGAFAALKYLFLGSLGASLYLLGVGYFYAATGTLNMDDIVMRLQAPDALQSLGFMGVLLVFLGIAIKMGLFPFHGWQPDAYAYGAGPAVTLIAPIVTKVAAYALIRYLFWIVVPAGIDIYFLLLCIKTMGISAVVIGSVMAFKQQNIRRMLAYSSVSHMGLIAMGIGMGTKTALAGALLHMFYHALMKFGLFLAAVEIETRYGIKNVRDLSRIRGAAPLTMILFTVCALSMAGVPPLAGFFSKWYLLYAAALIQDYLSAFVIAASSLLSGLYFFKALETGLFKPAAEQGDKEPLPPTRALPFFTLALGSAMLLLGFWSPFLFKWLSDTALKEIG